MVVEHGRLSGSGRLSKTVVARVSRGVFVECFTRHGQALRVFDKSRVDAQVIEWRFSLRQGRRASQQALGGQL